MNDDEFNDFKVFLSDKSYDYKTETEKALETLKSKSEKENYFSSLETKYEDLFDEFEMNKKNDLSRNKETIKEILSEEIASRYYFQNGRIRASLKYDKEIIEATKFLKDKSLYDSVLTVSN